MPMQPPQQPAQLQPSPVGPVVPAQPAPVQEVPVGLVVSAPQVFYQNRIGKKPEFGIWKPTTFQMKSKLDIFV